MRRAGVPRVRVGLAATREAAIAVVAQHADQGTWNALRVRAKAAPEPVEKQRLYEALGRALDPALASKAAAVSKKITIRSTAMFSELDVEQLVQHDAFILTATLLNG